MQIWAFVVVTDREQITAIADTHREVGRAYIRDGVLADPNLDAARERVYTNAMHNVEHLDEAPALIVPCLTLPCPDDADVASGLFGSIYPSIQNLMLAARERNLGTVLITLATDFSPIKPQHARPVRDILRLPDHVQAVALIPVGYPVGSFGPPLRDPWQDCIHWDTWS